MKKYIISLFFVSVIISLVFVFRPKVENKISDAKIEIEKIEETIIPQPTKILKTGLPNKHLINTAFIEQAPEHNWDQPWQDACEEASLLTVDFYYKNQIPKAAEQRDAILKMIEFENQQGWTHDITITQMAAISSQYLGYTPQIIEEPTIEQIKQFISQNIPVIITANGKILYKENKNFRSGGPYYHSLAILGYDDNKNQFTTHDVGTRKGAYFRYSYELLMESIHDFPSTGRKEDINTGAKRILVLLK